MTPGTEKLDLIESMIQRLNYSAAEFNLIELVKNSQVADLDAHEERLRAIVSQFHKRRKKKLTELLDGFIGNRTSARERLEKHETDLYRTVLRDRLYLLSEYHIFQWSTYYRNEVHEIFNELLYETKPLRAEAYLPVVAEELNRHATDIFFKGFSYVTQQGSPKEEAISKSISGLQQLLSLPIDVYGEFFYGLKSARQAKVNRAICSAVLSGVLTGYCGLTFGGERGASVLRRFVRSWASTLGFLTRSDAECLATSLGSSEFSQSIECVLVPVLGAIDELAVSASNDLICVPRICQFTWNLRSWSIFLSLPKTVTTATYLELQCYSDSSLIRPLLLDEAVSKGTTLIAGPVPADVKTWVEEREALRGAVLDTRGRTTAQLSSSALDTIRAELDRKIGGSTVNNRLSINYARTFPLNDPTVRGYFLVQRRSVRELLRTFELDSGIHLWCSVRRSGKTTACFELGATGDAAQIVRQTMDFTGQLPESNVFRNKFMDALSSGGLLPDTFFREAIRSSIRGISVFSRTVFVLDEYETLFDTLKTSILRNREVRYLIAQPLLNQMVEFSRENVLIFLGQRPDAHQIIMDQNQLSPYVRQDTFPLFSHAQGEQTSEFTELVRKVLTERVSYDADFVDAVFAETSGHPFLTVEVLIEFCDWLIANSRSANDLFFSVADWMRFAEDRLTIASLKRSRTFTFFRGTISDAISEESRHHAPWIYAVHEALRLTARENSGVPETEFPGELERYLGDDSVDPDYLLLTAQMSNFLKISNGNVLPSIPLMGRLALAAHRQIR